MAGIEHYHGCLLNVEIVHTGSRESVRVYPVRTLCKHQGFTVQPLRHCNVFISIRYSVIRLKILRMRANMEKTLEKINGLLIEQGKTQSSLCDYLGIRSDMYSRWKKGDSRSYMFDIGRIADFFNVSADYLLGRIDRDQSNGQFTASEIRILTRIKALSDTEQLWLLQAIGYLERPKT